MPATGKIRQDGLVSIRVEDTGVAIN